MRSRVLIVEWLGRGGIAQNTEAWALELGTRGYEVDVVTRPNRELGQGRVHVHAARAARTRLGAHRAVARAAARRIRETQPDWVVVQNYVLPVLERPVFRAAREAGANVAVVVHNHRLHSHAAGLRAGLGRNLAGADVLIAHTHFVADRVADLVDGREIAVVPHPVPIGLLWHEQRAPDVIRDRDPADRRWCAHFGTLRRRYKGTALVEELARAGVDGWRFVILGAGAASRRSENLVTIDGFVEPGVLVGAVSATDVTLAPYRTATQSGVVVLAHALGSVPVASAVGGIPEQVTHDVDGILVATGSGANVWRAALEALRDDDHRKELARAGERRAWADHEAFVAGVVELLR